MKGVGDNEHNRGDVIKENDAQSWYLHTPFDMAEAIPIKLRLDMYWIPETSHYHKFRCAHNAKNIYLKEWEKVTKGLPKDPCALECCVRGDGDSGDAHDDV